MIGEDTEELVKSRIGLRVTRLSLTGRHTRYMLAGYLRHMFVLTFALLTIALTIDLWPQLQTVATAREADGLLMEIWSVVRFSLLRTPNLVAPFLPFATFLGVLWSEAAHTRNGERILILNSGRSPIQCLAPALLLGVILGAAEFALDAYLGPAAMAVQMQERLGLDGQRLDRTRMGESHWIVAPGGLLKAEIEYGPPPVLRNITFSKLDAAGRLTEVDSASEARRLPEADLWLMRDGRYWSAEEKPKLDPAAPPLLAELASENMTPFAERTIRLELDPLWLSVFGMEPQYLPLTALRPLAQTEQGVPSQSLYRTRLQMLYGEILLPGAMALLAASLSMLLLAHATPLGALISIIFVGYLAHSGTKACLLMGQNGYMPAVMAGWLVPIALLAATFSVFALFERQRRGPKPPAA